MYCESVSVWVKIKSWVNAVRLCIFFHHQHPQYLISVSNQSFTDDSVTTTWCENVPLCACVCLCVPPLSSVTDKKKSMVQLLLHPWRDHMQMVERTCSLIQSAGDFTLPLLSGYLSFQCKKQNKTPKQKITYFLHWHEKGLHISGKNE